MNKIVTHDLKVGCCLVAPPTMKDQRFSKSVILITAHGSEGSMGFILNKPTSFSIAQITESDDFRKIGDYEVNWGGPVHNNVVHLLHTRDWQTDKTRHITEEISITSDGMMFRYLENGTMPDQWKAFLGFSSWSNNQLEGELTGQHPWTPDQSWLILRNPNSEMMFNLEGDEMWNEALSFCSMQAVNDWF